jgi:hypothetical protein
MRASNTALLLGLLVTTAACSKGGNLVLEPGSRPTKNSGSPFVRVNQGGKATIIQTGGFTVDNGVHAAITVQPMSAQNLTGSNGVTGVINKASK